MSTAQYLILLAVYLWLMGSVLMYAFVQPFDGAKLTWGRSVRALLWPIVAPMIFIFSRF